MVSDAAVAVARERQRCRGFAVRVRCPASSPCVARPEARACSRARPRSANWALCERSRARSRRQLHPTRDCRRRRLTWPSPSMRPRSEAERAPAAVPSEFRAGGPILVGQRSRPSLPLARCTVVAGAFSRASEARRPRARAARRDQMLRDHLDVGEHRHEVRVAAPARHDVQVPVVGDAGAGDAAEVPAEVEALGRVDGA